jgi:DNA-binding response OmpR family regulator
LLSVGTTEAARLRRSNTVPCMVAERSGLDILVCDDEAELREALRQSFEREGHRVVAVADGRGAIEAAAAHSFDVLLLDVSLGPNSIDGFAVCRHLRQRRDVLAIIMLTARESEADAVLGLEAGADDYVVKPFRPVELRSRIRAVLRRAAPRVLDEEVLRVGSVSLDVAGREVRRGDEVVGLTFSEFELLRALMLRPGVLLNRQELLRAIWGDSAYRDPRAIDVHIRHLREKLEQEPENPQLILTVRGVGYRIHEP